MIPVPSLLRWRSWRYTDLYALQKWARRNMTPSHKLRYVIGFLKHRKNDDRDEECIDQLIEDDEHIASTISVYGRRLEATIPIVCDLTDSNNQQSAIINRDGEYHTTYLFSYGLRAVDLCGQSI